jgi:hypothetical protein
MYTSMLLVALTGFSAGAEEGLTWHTDYSQARKQGQGEKKPLAVFVAPSKDGWKKLSREGKLGKEIERTLEDSYVCVHVDSATPAGKKLASALGLESGLGIVISDSKGELMAFYHEGDLANRDIARYLKRYADPDRVVSHTESNPGRETTQSYYPPQYYPQPAFFGGFGGGRGGC